MRYEMIEMPGGNWYVIDNTENSIIGRNLSYEEALDLFNQKREEEND